jgi:hypothetical protein
MWSKFGIALCLFYISFTGFSQQPDFDYAPDDFAKFLYSSELYEFASEEYERLHFMYPDSLQYFRRLLSSYKLSNNSAAISHRLEFKSIKDPKLLGDYVDILLATKNTKKGKSLFLDNINLFEPLERDEFEFKLAVAEYDWRQVIVLNEKAALNNKYDNIVQKIESSKFKSPVLASILSGLIPGAGRFYAKDPKDALVSILFIATSGYQAYRRFNQKGIKSVGGWIFAGVSFGFYIGNIYGSNKSARFYNQRVNDQIYNYAIPIISDYSN